MQNLVPLTLKKIQPKALKSSSPDDANVFSAKNITQLFSHLEDNLTLRKILIEAVILSKALIWKLSVFMGHKHDAN